MAPGPHPRPHPGAQARPLPQWLALLVPAGQGHGHVSMARSALGSWPWLKHGRCPHCSTLVMADGHDFGLIAMLLVKKPAPCAVNSQKAWPTASDPVAISASSTGKSISLPPAQARAHTTGPTYSPCLQAPGVLCRAFPVTEHPAMLHLSGYLSSPIKLAAPAIS